MYVSSVGEDLGVICLAYKGTCTSAQNLEKGKEVLRKKKKKKKNYKSSGSCYIIVSGNISSHFCGHHHYTKHTHIHV